MNHLKTVLLLGLLTGLLLGVGYSLGGRGGLQIALILSVLMNLGAYWFSDKFVLAMYRAVEIPSADQPRLHAIVEDLAQRAKIPKPRIYLVDLPVPNAFATGRNPAHAVVAVTPGLLQALDERELRAVLAHELCHVKNRDILVSSVAATMAGAISYLAQMAMWGGRLFGTSRDNEGVNPLGMLVMFILTPLVATLIHLAISRSREFLADETGARVSGSPLDLASALRKLEAVAQRHPLVPRPKHEATAHLFIVNPFEPGLLTRLFSTHPPVEDRIARLQNM